MHFHYVIIELIIKKGGLVNQRHNKVRDALGDLAAIVYKAVVRKPIVQEADDSSIRRVW